MWFVLQTDEDCKCACVQIYHVINKNKRSLNVTLICWRFSFKGSMHKSKPFYIPITQIKTAILLLFVIINYIKQKMKTNFKDWNFQQVTPFYHLRITKTVKYAVKFTTQFFVVSDTLTSSALVFKTLTWTSWVCRSSSNQ